MHTFTALEDKVTGWQLSADTQNEIIEALSAEAQAGLLALLKITYNADEECSEFVFRYKSNTLDSELKVGDYLVQLNSGEFVKKSASEFEANYLHTDCDAKQTVTKVFKDAVMEKFSVTADQYTIQDLPAILEAAGVYNATEDKIVLDLRDLGLNEFSGFEILYKAAVHMASVKDTTTVKILLGNTSEASINLFNLIALQNFQGIFARMDKTQRARLIALDFTGNPTSAIAASVKEATWMDWVDDIRSVTGISRNSAVTR